MKKLLWMMLATLPTQAMANNEDPIAYKCYYCTPAEMEDVALAQGVGRHYVYDAQKFSIMGFEVISSDGALTATQFPTESWVRMQIGGMLEYFNNSTGEMKIPVSSHLYAPDTEHARFNRYIWGHHLSELNPRHKAVRETLHRYLTDHNRMRFLDTSISGGRLIRFEYMVDGNSPIIAEVSHIDKNYGTSQFYFDHDSRRWRYVDSTHRVHHSDVAIEESRDDFAPNEGTTRHDYGNGSIEIAQAFLERAQWASIPVHGTLPTTGDAKIRCERKADDIQCYID